MKKLITYISLCLIAILLMPGCRSKMGMMKRHYSKGYYVSHSQGKNKTLAAKAEPMQIATDEIPTVVILKTPTSNLKEQSVPTHTESIMASAHPAEKGNVNPDNKTSYKSIVVNNPIKEVRNTISQIGMADGERDALSLFWIIILVILILWLFGFLLGGFGLGGLINLLLVIALILLILWLLRIV
jgi:hypothetical protein